MRWGKRLIALGALGAGLANAAAATDGAAARAEKVLAERCAKCHTPGGDAASVMDFILDRKALVDNDEIVPGDAAGSELFARVAARTMPPRKSGIRLEDSEIETLRAWIEAGAPDWKAPAVQASSFVDDDEIARRVAADLDSIPARNRRFMRYFTLAHLANSGRIDETELELHRAGLSKLMNSLSWGAKIVPPRAVDPARTIFRVDLRDYRWNKKTWETLAAKYPYATGSRAPESEQIKGQAGTQRPILRGDWFAREASRPPLYHDLLGIPATERELQRILQINADEDIRQETVARAGFNRSGVSVNNRVIERHASPHGAYWRSFDFAGNCDRENIFKSPLGPNLGPGSFAHAGGEIIFSLPNGLQGYMLTNARGDRIDKGPTAIVSDPSRPDRAVENGLSCMGCHERGVIRKEDQIRPLVEGNRRAFGRDAETILALYPPEPSWESLWKEDEARFARAAEACGVDPKAPEPIAAMAARYESPLDAARAAAETGLTEREFLSRLPASGAAAREVGPLRLAGGSIQREAFEAEFSDLARAIGLPEEGAAATSAQGFFAEPARVARETTTRPIREDRTKRRLNAAPTPPLRPQRTPRPLDPKGAGTKADDFWGK